jgi:hypothetical protein
MRLTEEEVQRLRENGFSDQDINDYAASLEQQAQPIQEMAPVQPTELPTIDEKNIPPLPEPITPGIASTAATTLIGAPGAIKEYALPAAELYGAYKAVNALGPGIEAWKQSSLAKQADAAARQARAASDIATEQGRAARAAGRVPGPVAPSPTSPIVNSAGRPMPMSTGPAPVVRESVGMRNMPTQAATGTAATGVMARGAEYAAKIRELAAQKALQVAPNVARVGVGATAALMPGNVGQNYNVPTTGPLRGSEINPETRRPWTPEELARYNAQYTR